MSKFGCIATFEELHMRKIVFILCIIFVIITFVCSGYRNHKIP